MIKQGLVQDTLTDINTPHLPPLNNLPQWSRINTLDKARYPKPFKKDRLQPLPNPAERNNAQDEGEDDSDGTEQMQGTPLSADASLSANMSPGPVAARITHLERSLIFIQQQHQDVLKSLHGEIDNLKRENKDLQFQVIVLSRSDSPVKHGTASASKRDRPSPPQSGHSNSRSAASRAQERSAKRRQKPAADLKLPSAKKDPTSKPNSTEHEVEAHSLEAVELSNTIQQGTVDKDDSRVQQLEEELKELKKTLMEEQSRNMVLSQMLEHSDPHLGEEHLSGQSPASEVMSAPAGPHSAQQHGTLMQRGAVSASNLPAEGATSTQEVLPYGAKLGPLQVTIPPHPPRPPTLPECETIIRHLLNKTERQNHELTQLKSDLRDVLYSHKWTPDAYLMAKAYIVQDEAKEAAIKGHLPKIPLIQQNRRLPDSAYMSREQTSLPALKQTLGNKAIERRKRTQILQQTRKSREVLSGIKGKEDY